MFPSQQPHTLLKRQSDRPRRKPPKSANSPGNRLETAQENTASQKCSITLYQTDLNILDEIRQYLRQKGIRNLSDSEGLRLACRTVSLDDLLVKTYEAMKLDDGRRRRVQR